MPNQVRIRAAAIAILAAALTLTIAGCGSSASKAASGTAADQNSGGSVEPLIIGSDETYPPYSYRNNGTTLAGFDPELAALIAKQLGTTAKFTDTRFSQIIVGLQSKRYNAIFSSLYITAARAKQVDLIPYFDTGSSIVVKSGSNVRPATQWDLCGLRVGLNGGSALVQSLETEVAQKCKAAGKQPPRVLQFPSDAEADQAVLSGGADVNLTDAAVAKVGVDESGGRLEITSTSLLYPIPCGIAVRKGDTKLKNELVGAINQLKNSGEYQALFKKYSLSQVDPTLVEKALAG